MRQEVNLYLGDMQVEFSQPPQILYNYIQDEVTNPTVIKNSFSKTITVEGTNNNNKIFGHFWNLERLQEYGSYTGTYFNASRKTPFQLFVNGDIYESGYVKLVEVRKTGNGIQYDIELFGGLGSFFYGLTYNQDNGNKLKLSDLNYRKWPEPDKEFDFTVDKNTLKQAWYDHTPNADALSLWHYINFAPAYNGLPSKNFSSDKVLINCSGAPSEIVTKADSDKKIIEDLATSGTYITYGDGYVNATLPKKMTEWEMGDIRSGWQRPVIRMKEIINASIKYMQKPENGGWQVELDSDFFNSDNPYWEKSWMTLPLLSEINYVNEVDADIAPTLSISRTTHQDGYSVFSITGMNDKVNKLILSGRYGINSFSDISSYSKLYTSLAYYTDYGRRKTLYDGAVIMRVEALNRLGTVVATSPWNYLTSERGGDYNWDLLNGFVWDYVTRSSIIQCPGYFQKNGNQFNWVDESGNTVDLTFELDMQGRAYTQLRLVVQWLGNQNLKWNNNGTLFKNRFYNRTSVSQPDWTSQIATEAGSVNEHLEIAFVSATNAGDRLLSGKVFGKNDLLNTSYTPADYFIGFCKLFNLHFRKDTFANKLYIETRKNYYTSDIVDLNEFIDRGKDIKINPVSFEKQWYDLKLPMVEGEFATDYKNTTSFDYGTKRINTGYEFDSDVKDLLSGTPYKSAIQSLEKSKYYSYCGTGVDDDTDKGFQPWMLEGLKYNLYNRQNVDDTCEIELPVRYSSLQGISTYSKYYDLYDKPQFHSEDNKTIDGSGVLLFFNGYEKCISPNSVDLNYWLTDDLPAMESLNSNSCWLYTNDEYNEAGEQIAIKVDKLPRFSRYWLQGDVINHSMDFGQPRQLYAPNLTTIEESTIYYNYWKTYIEDIYDVNTKVLDCYVKLDNKPNPEWLRRFYWFDNSIWRLEKIQDWSISSFETTKMQFVKVQDMANYSNEVVSDAGIITITANTTTVPSEGGSVTFTVTVTDGSCWEGDENWDLFFGETPTGCGNKTFTLNVDANQQGRLMRLNVINENNVAGNGVVIEQKPIEFTVNQFAQYTYTNVPATGGTCLYNVRCTGSWTVTSDRTYCVPLSAGGTGNTEYGETLQVRWSENDTVTIRQAILTFTDSNGNVIKKIKGQDGQEFLKIHFPYSGGTEVIEAKSNATEILKPDWITIVDNGNDTYNIYAKFNEGSYRCENLIFNYADGTRFTILAEQDYYVEEEEGITGNTSALTVTQFAQYSNTNVPRTGGTCLYNVRSTSPWTVTSDRTYCIPLASGGTGNTEYGQTLQVQWSENTSISFRDAILTFTNTDGGLVRVKKYQDGYTVSELDYPASGATQSVEWNNSGATVVTKPDWITVVEDDGDYDLTADANNGGERNGTVVLEDADGNQLTVYVKQAGGEGGFNVEPQALSFEGSGSTATITITNTNNNSWSVVGKPDWISVSQNSGNSAATITVTASTNTVEYDRIGTIVINNSTTNKTYTVICTQAAGLPAFAVNPSFLYFENTGGTLDFVIKNDNNVNWQIVGKPNWISVSSNSGNTTATITASAMTNTGDERTGAIVVYNAATNINYPVLCSQIAVSQLITITPNPATAASGGETIYVTLNYINRNGDSVNATATGGARVGNIIFTGDTATVAITVPENDGFSAKTYTVTFNGMYVSGTLTINQEAKEAYLRVEPTSLTFGATGGTATITINTNDNWTIS